MTNPNFIDSIIQKGKQASTKVISEFDSLSAEQLNWKPAPDKWSIAECLNHLIVSDTCYLPVFMLIGNNKYRMSWWERHSWLSGFWGKALVKQLSETPKRKLKTPKTFRPQLSNIDGDIILEYNSHLDRFLIQIEKLKPADLDKTILTSPANRFITYDLRHCLQFLMQHEHRHINQAIKLKKLENFPR